MKTIRFNHPVSATSGSYIPNQDYTVSDDIAADMIRAGHAFEVQPATNTNDNSNPDLLA